MSFEHFWFYLFKDLSAEFLLQVEISKSLDFEIGEGHPIFSTYQQVGTNKEIYWHK